MIFQICRTYYRDMSVYEDQLKQAGFALNTVVERNGENTWYEHTVEINSIEELVKLQEAIGQDLIFLYQSPGDPELEIYDDYRE